MIDFLNNHPYQQHRGHFLEYIASGCKEQRALQYVCPLAHHRIGQPFRGPHITRFHTPMPLSAAGEFVRYCEGPEDYAACDADAPDFTDPSWPATVGSRYNPLHALEALFKDHRSTFFECWFDAANEGLEPSDAHWQLFSDDVGERAHQLVDDMCARLGKDLKKPAVRRIAELLLQKRHIQAWQKTMRKHRRSAHPKRPPKQGSSAANNAHKRQRKNHQQRNPRARVARGKAPNPKAPAPIARRTRAAQKAGGPATQPAAFPREEPTRADQHTPENSEQRGLKRKRKPTTSQSEQSCTETESEVSSCDSESGGSDSDSSLESLVSDESSMSSGEC